MDATVFTTLGVGVSLAAIVLNGQRSLRNEIAAVETRLGKRIDANGKRIDDTKSELRGEINGVESRLRGEIGAVETRLRGEIGAVETRLGKQIDGVEDRVHGLSDRFSQLQGGLSAVFGPLGRGALPEPSPDESPA